MSAPKHVSWVTGGAGFVGSHLCEELLARGDTVVALDDFSTGSRDNVASFARHPRFHLVEHDVIRPLPEGAPLPSRIFNLACPASPPRYQRDPVRTTLISVLGTLHGLELARAHGARFLQASTSEVYGDPFVHPQPEGYHGSVNPIGPRACYDEGKRCAESLVMDFHRTHGLQTRIARIFNTYGPRMALDDGRVVSNFLVQALRGEPLTVYGSGEQTRSFCFVDDLVSGLIALIEHPSLHTPCNLGNPEEFTMRELATRVRELAMSSSELHSHPLPIDDPRQRRPDITLARTELRFQPGVGLAAGLTRTMADFQRRVGSGIRTVASRAVRTAGAP